MEAIKTMLAGIRVNTHSSIRIRAGEKLVYIDPFELPAAPHDADLIFITHDHFDHYSPEDIQKLLKPETVFVMPRSTAELAGKHFGQRQIVTAVPGAAGEAAGLRFEAVPAYNLGKPFHPRQNGWLGYVLHTQGLRIYIAGDTDATEEAAALRCDIALLPIGGKYTMDAGEAAALVRRMKPRAVIPVHYGSVAGSPEDYERFAAAAGADTLVCRKL